MGEPAEFTLDRVFSAPRELVWRAWTEPGLLNHWFGPKGSRTRFLSFDLRPGGTCHFEIDFKSGPAMYGRFVYQDIAEPERLSWHHGSANRGGDWVRYPGQPGWPLILLTMVRFEAAGQTTRVRLSWTPLDAAPGEIELFAGSAQSMRRGWAGSYDMLDALLARLKQGGSRA